MALGHVIVAVVGVCLYLCFQRCFLSLWMELTVRLHPPSACNCGYGDVPMFGNPR